MTHPSPQGRNSIIKTSCVLPGGWRREVTHRERLRFPRWGLRVRKSSTWELAGEFPRPHPDLLSETLVAEAGSAPGLGVSPRGGNGNPPQYSCLGNAPNGGAQRATERGWQRVGHDREAEVSQLVFNKPSEWVWRLLRLQTLDVGRCWGYVDVRPTDKTSETLSILWAHLLGSATAL